MQQFFLLVCALFLFGCQQKFNKATWVKESDNGNYPERNKMLTDLTENYQLKGITYWQLHGLLGEPLYDHFDNTYYYQILTQYGGVDPVYTKSLVFWLSK